MINLISSWLLYFGVIATILYVGWEQPLRYRFMSRQEIAELTNPKPEPQPELSTRTPPSRWRPLGTALDRAPYETRNDGIDYTSNIDSRSMGTRSEQERRENLFKGSGAR